MFDKVLKAPQTMLQPRNSLCKYLLKVKDTKKYLVKVNSVIYSSRDLPRL